MELFECAHRCNICVSVHGRAKRCRAGEGTLQLSNGDMRDRSKTVPIRKRERERERVVIKEEKRHHIKGRGGPSCVPKWS